MKDISEAEFKEITRGNTESLNLEFKSAFNFGGKEIKEVWMREEVIRSILAMSNTRDGGTIVIGIKENADNTFEFTGIPNTDLLSFQREDDFKAKIESFSALPVDYELGIAQSGEEKFIIIIVPEYSRFPAICKKTSANGEKNLEEGAIYIRALKDKPSSIKMSNPVDILDFLERAADKQILNLHKREWKHSIEAPASNTGYKNERTDF